MPTPTHDVTIPIDTDQGITARLVTPEDVSGWTVVLTITPEAGGAPAVTKSTTAGTITIVDAALGKWSFVISPDANGLTANARYNGRLRVTNVGERDVLAKYRIGIEPVFG